MSYNVAVDTITIGGSDFDIDRTTDHSDGSETLTVDTEGTGYDFDGLEGHLAFEQHDAEVFSPRDWSNVGTMCVSYDRYNLGDESIKEIDFEITCPKCEGTSDSGHWVVGIHNTATRLAIGSEEEAYDYLNALPDVASGRYYIEPLRCDKCDGEGVLQTSIVDYFKKERGARVVLPLIVYEHSGITMQVGRVGDYAFDQQGWDTSFVGVIFDTPKGVKECLGDSANDKEIEKALRSEVAVYASYLEGDITWWSVEDDETNFNEGCGGYVGDHDGCENDCFAAMEKAMIARIKEQDERAYWLARDVMTV